MYQALYLLTRDQGKSKEAEQWAREWVNRPAKSTDELWKQARIAGQIQETQQQQQLIETICRQKGEPHPGALLWQIKRNLAREQWEQALAGIKRLRKEIPTKRLGNNSRPYAFLKGREQHQHKKPKASRT